MINNKKIGFTLAETLIAIAVIGIISALTMPDIIKNYQKRHFLVKLKDTYSILQNAKLRAEADYGPMKNWEVENNSTFFLDKYIRPYLKLTETKERHASHYTNGTERRWQYDPFHAIPKYFLPNGVELAAGECRNHTNDVAWKYCAIYIDLNGTKGPNMSGKDMFGFSYWFNPTYPGRAQYKGQLAPIDYKSAENRLQDGCLIDYENVYALSIQYCTSAIFKNNWQYPDWFPY